MFLFDWFRSFLPLRNPIGFGAADFVELAIALLLVLVVVARVRLDPRVHAPAKRTGLCMILLGLLPLVLRLAMLPQSPVPTPSGADDFAHLLAADTLRQFRLAKSAPSHAPFLRRRLHSPGARLQLHLSARTGTGVGRRLDLLWTPLGRRHPLRKRVRSPLLLDAARVDHARLGARRRAAGDSENRPAALLDEYLSGGGFRNRRLPDFRSAAARARRRPHRDAVLLGIGFGLQWLARPFETLLSEFARL